jgi:hypothetical protein
MPSSLPSNDAAAKPLPLALVDIVLTDVVAAEMLSWLTDVVADSHSNKLPVSRQSLFASRYLRVGQLL